jgi:iron complex outermembrane receptor protein
MSRRISSPAPLALCALLGSGALYAADSEGVSEGANDEPLQEVTVVGSNITGGGAAEALPVLTVDREQLESTGATDGDELIRSLPQFGDILFTNKAVNSGRNSNGPRGDVGSVNLRNLGAEYTLLLVNGRRTVQHPVSGNAGRTSYNSNAIPTFGLERLDLLLDGAAAVYGSDAVAGVVDLQTQRDLNGGGLKLEYGSVHEGHREDLQLDGYFGRDFAEGRGNVSLLFGVSHRSAQLNSDEWFNATDGRLLRADGTSIPDPDAPVVAPNFGNGVWGTFQRYNNGIAVGAPYYVGLDGNVVQGTIPAAIRLADTGAEPGVTESPEVKKGNLFATARFDLTDDLQLFGELGYYRAKSESWLSGDHVTLSGTNYVHIRPDAYWVPEALRQGTDAIRLVNYYVADYGLRRNDVDNVQSRALAGLRGEFGGGWDWETAVLYSRARSTDVQETGQANAFVDAVNRTDASAYNPFNGGDPSNPRVGDGTPSDAALFVLPNTREGTSELALWDFKVNRPDVLSWYAADNGLAPGDEYRYESRVDNRDENIDGTVTYTDWYTGNVSPSNVFTHSTSTDVSGSRNVKSAFLELAVPLVSAEQGIPLVQSLDLQLAGRYEEYSDAGDVAKPKFAVAWRVLDSLLLRGSTSGGFRAPGVELANSGTVIRFGGGVDPVRCEALVEKGTFANYNACSASPTVRATINNATSYGEGVDPETTQQHSYGFVFEPAFLPEGAGNFLLSVDAWQVEIENPIGNLGSTNELLYDAYLRTVEGSFNPNVVRAAPTAADIALFAGSGITPAGVVTNVLTSYENQQPLLAKGLDYNFSWRSAETRWGNFALLLNASQLQDYTQQKPSQLQIVANAIANGQLHIIAQGLAAANEVGLNGAKPEWRASATLLWNNADWTVRLRDNYIDSVISGAYGNGTPFVVDATHRWALSVRKDFSAGWLQGSALEVGGRNIFDEEPPLSASGNYLASLHESFGRSLYFNISKRF